MVHQKIRFLLLLLNKAKNIFTINKHEKVHFPFAYKLALSMIVLIVSGMLLLGGLIIRDQNKLLEKQLHSNAKILINQLAASATESFLTTDNLDLDVMVKNIVQYPEILGIAFYSDEKKQLSNDGFIPPTTDFLRAKDGIFKVSWLPSQTNLKANNQSTQPNKFSIERAYLSYIGSVNYQDVIIGYVLLTFDQSLFYEARDKTLSTIVLTTIVLIFFSIMFAFFLGKRLTQPINALVDVSEAISRGDYKIRFDERRNDEFGILMNSLNIMAEGLLHKKSVEKAFARYLSPTVAKEILANLESINLGGQQVEASVLFVDIIGFTQLSKSMGPKKTNQLLNDYFSYIAQAAQFYGGHVDKFMGDCVMLVFGVPTEDKNHSRNAILCALLIQNIILKMNLQRILKGEVPVNFHIAANSGLMWAGNMGSKQRMEYTVIGDAVNLASRIANHARNNEVVIPDTMLDCSGVRENFDITEKDCIQIRGHDKAVTLYRVNLCNSDEIVGLREKMDKLIDDDFT